MVPREKVFSVDLAVFIFDHAGMMSFPAVALATNFTLISPSSHALLGMFPCTALMVPMKHVDGALSLSYFYVFRFCLKESDNAFWVTFRSNYAIRIIHVVRLNHSQKEIKLIEHPLLHDRIN